MFKLAVFACVLVLGTSAVPRQPRIVGGKEAVNGQFPHSASIRDQWAWRNTCAGSIIANYWILTAANCVYEKKPHHIHITVGSVDLHNITQKHDVYEIYTRGYNPKGFTNDIALLKLKTPIEYNEFVKPIALSNDDILDGSLATYAGWGWTSAVMDKTNILQYLDVHVVNNDECIEAHQPFPVTVSEQLCVIASYKHGACDEDGGAALVQNGKQIGIFSWLRPCAIGIPDVFTRVKNFLPWIEEISGVKA